MERWHRQFPSQNYLQSRLMAMDSAAFTYREIGATRGAFPGGYKHDRRRFLLGKGPEVWERAQVALSQGRQFPPGWTQIYYPMPAWQPGAALLMLFRLGGLWWVNTCRIVYVIEEANRYGFAYGTLPGHVECGEEYFGVEMDEHQQVWFVLEAFSRPRFWAAWPGYPLARFMQARFARHAGLAMQAAAQKSE